MTDSAFGFDNPPDPGTLLAALRAGLTTQTFGRPHESRWLGSVESTNLIARAAALDGAPEGTLVVAEEQVAGRGRLGRRWLAPYGSSLLVSLLLRPPPTVRPTLLPFVAAVALAETLERRLGLVPELKWPNDVRLDGRKLAGILAETEYAGDRLDAVVVGVGLNCNIEARVLAELDQPATSLLAALGHPVDRVALLAAFLEEWERRYQDLLAGRSPLPDWQRRAWMLGRPVTVYPVEGAPWMGVAIGLSEAGALFVRDEAGACREVQAADVSVHSVESPGEAP